MKAILIPISEEQAATVKEAARKAGLSQRAFCRRAVLAAIQPDQEMLREIHEAVCGTSDSSESKLAEVALVKMGLAPAEARTKVSEVVLKKPDANAEDIIRKAFQK